MIDGVLLDLDGVFYEGERLVPGGTETLAWLQEQRLPFLLVTNTTSRPRSALVEKLHGFGIEVDPERILTPVVAAASWLAARHRVPVAPFFPAPTQGDLGDVERLDESAEEGAGAVIVGDLGEAWDFARLNRAFRLLMAEPRPVLVALGMTRYWKAEDGLRLDTAPFVRALEHAAGVEATVLGKPAAEFFRTACERLGTDPAHTLMVGDDVRADVGGAQAAGLRGALVRTGKFQAADLEGDVAPDAVLGSIAELPPFLRTNR